MSFRSRSIRIEHARSSGCAAIDSILAPYRPIAMPMHTTTTLDDYAARIRRVLEHVQSHLDHALAPADLAEIACFSPFHFQRIFRALVGESVMGHVRRLRLERAAWRLKFGDTPVTALAFEAGYEAHEAFTRAFRARFGCSPSAFRARHRAIPFPSVPSKVHYDPGGAVTSFEPGALDPADLEVEIRQLPSRFAASVRHVGPYEEVGESWGKLTAWLAAEGLFAPGVEMLGLCYDDPEITPRDQRRYDACATLDIDFETPGGGHVEGPAKHIRRREIPGGEFAVARHVGPYQELRKTYFRLIGHWLPLAGREPGEPPCIEQYWNNPEDTPPEELETDVFLRLRSE